MKSLACFLFILPIVLQSQNLPGSKRNQPEPPAAVLKWLRKSGLSLRESGQICSGVLSKYQVVGLGEATHGQHEAFETKRNLTMQLIREHGYRLVAYEASASSAVGCDDYISGRSDDRSAAIRSLGMLIWQVEENGALLDDLRAWNEKASPEDQVKFIGIDAQDEEAMLERLDVLCGEKNRHLAQDARKLIEQGQSALQKLFTEGNQSELDQVMSHLIAWEEAVKETEVAKLSETALRMMELRSYLTMYATPGGRDQAMAALLLAQLQNEKTGTGCVIWGHNGHISKGPLRYLGSEELAMGGHLARELAEKYYAVGFAFGEGEFQANAQNQEGVWGFRRYKISPAPKGSLDACLTIANKGDFLIDLRNAPATPAIRKWLTTGHGHRWWGGYNISDDCDERSKQVSQLLKTWPKEEYDAFIFLQKTSAATPVDKTRIW